MSLDGYNPPHGALGEEHDCLFPSLEALFILLAQLPIHLLG